MTVSGRIRLVILSHQQHYTASALHPSYRARLPMFLWSAAYVSLQRRGSFCINDCHGIRVWTDLAGTAPRGGGPAGAGRRSWPRRSMRRRETLQRVRSCTPRWARSPCCKVRACIRLVWKLWCDELTQQ